MPLNPEALEPLYKAAKNTLPAVKEFGYPGQWRQVRDAIALAESTPAEPSGLTQANAEAQVLVDCLNEALKDTDRLDGRQISIRVRTAAFN